MSYKKSNSRRSFENRVENLRVSSKVASIKSNSIPKKVRDLSFHAAILETSAALEEYVKNFLEDYIFSLKRSESPLRSLPRETRTFLLIQRTLPHYENLAYSRNEREALKKLDVDSDSFSMLDPSSPIDKIVKAEVLLDKKKYPSPKNWSVLFYRIGIDDIFVATSRRTRRDTRSILQSFNDVRTALAHGEAPDLTYEDVVRHLGNMRSLIGSIDRVLCSHCCRHTGLNSWPSDV